jgi:hypothetical protein
MKIKTECKLITIFMILILIFNISPIIYANGITEIIDDLEYYAIIIGIEEVQGVNLPEKKYIDETAEAFYNKLLLGDNWKNENIKLLLNEHATKENIRDLIINWLDPLETSNDVIIIYFNGHTYKLPNTEKTSGKTYSIPYDTNNLEYSEDKITDKELNTWIDNLESDHVNIILDTPHSGKMISLRQIGRVVIASTARFISCPITEDDEIESSIFTYYLMQGLNGHADLNNDEWISIKEAYKYSKEKSFEHSMNLLFSSINNFSKMIIPQMPTIYDLHFQEIPIISLSFGWKQIEENGFGKTSNYATRGFEIFNDELYIGTQNNLIPQFTIEEEYIKYVSYGSLLTSYNIMSKDSDWLRISMRLLMHIATWASEGCEIWKYNYTTDQLTQVIGSNSITGINSGFNTNFNAASAILKEFNGYLYVGTWNTPISIEKNQNRNGCEIWRTNDGINWEQVVGEQALYTKGGFGNPDNVGAWSIEEFNGYLYVGTMNWDFTEQGGCEVFRSEDGVHWEQVVSNGFRGFMENPEYRSQAINTYAWTMKVYKNQLYLGTFNSRLDIIGDNTKGCQLWTTINGKDWEKVPLPDGTNNGFKDGFGEPENYGIRRLTIYNDELYVGVASSFFNDNGCEIWKYDGINWTPIIGDDVPGINPNDKLYDGFGNSLNKYIWTMTATSDNKLWIGTANCQVYNPLIFGRSENHNLLQPETEGFEIWCYDGTNWNPVIKNNEGLKPSGIGDSTNLGARSMIEYPKNSGNIIIGTFKLIKNNPTEILQGCELWMRQSYDD